MSVFSNRGAGSPDQAREYTDAILNLLGDRDPFDVLARTPDAVRRAVPALTNEQLHQPESPGKWSIAAVVQHLVDSEIVWAWRLRLVLAQDRPTLTGYDQDLWADRLGYRNTDVPTALDELTTLRTANLRLLARTTPADRQRVGVHLERGEESVDRMIRLYAGHDLLHLRQIERIRAAVS